MSDELIFYPKPGFVGTIVIIGVIFGLIFSIWWFTSALIIMLNMALLDWVYIFLLIMPLCICIIMILLLMFLIPWTPITMNPQYIQMPRTILHLIRNSYTTIKIDEIDVIKIRIKVPNYISWIVLYSKKKNGNVFINDFYSQKYMNAVYTYLQSIFKKEHFEITKSEW